MVVDVAVAEMELEERLMEIKRSWMCMAMLLPGLAFGQFFTGSGVDSPNSIRPWMDFKLNTKTKIKLDFRDANVDSIIGLYEKASGVTIVKDPTLTGKITITSAKPVTLNDAFAILKANLDLKGFDITKDGNFLVIKNRTQGGPGGGRNGGGIDFSSMMGGGAGGDQGNNVNLKVYPINFANAAQLAKVVNDVYSGNSLSPFGGGGNPFGGGGRFGGGGGGGQFGGRGGAAQFGGNNNTANMMRQMFGGGQNQPVVKASSDDYTNSVIISATDKDQRQVGDLIKQLDKNSEEPLKPHVFALKYASVNDVQPVVLNVLQTNAPKGKFGSGPQSLQSTFQNALRIGTGQAASGPVVSDLRTNSLVVTTTPANLQIVDKLISTLDQPVVFQSTTLVVPLENARADTVANLFLQAFGQRQGTTTSAANRNTFSGANTSSNSSVNGRTTGAGGAGGAARPGGDIGVGDNGLAQNALPINLQDPNAGSGDLLTSIGVVQGFGGGGGGGRGGFGGAFGGGGGAQAGTQNSVTQTRDASGQIVNLRDLTGNVTVIPNMDSNSLIVVTTPENREIIQNILKQLDKVPQQVMIQTIIVEATIGKAEQFGLEWKYSHQKGKTTNTGGDTFGLAGANPALQGFTYTLTGGDVTGFFNMLQTDTKFQVLSTPRIFTSNNTQAQINISQSIPYIVSTIQNTNGTNSFNYAFQDVGIVLTVTPRITSNGYVNMDVTQTANDLQGYTNFNAPIVNQRQADTTVSVKDGETIVLGGIMQSQVTATVNKIPLLGDIPLLGELFKSKTKNVSKTELLVFLTPTVIRDPAEAKKLKEQTQKEMSSTTQDDFNNLQPKKGGANPPVKKGGN